MDPKILFWDVENLYGIWRNWGPKAHWMGKDQLIRAPHLLTAAWCWGNERPQGIALTDFPDLFKWDHHDDESLCWIVWHTLEEADIIVHHNGDRFDIPKFEASCSKHGIPPLSPKRTVDTLKIARKRLGLPHYNLDALARHFGVARKGKTEYQMWIDCDDGKPEAFRKMLKYNKQDCVVLRDIYYKLLPYMDNHPNMNLYQGTQRCCPNCGSDNVKRNGFRYAKSRKYRQYRCNDCGKCPSDVTFESKAEIK